MSNNHIYRKLSCPFGEKAIALLDSQNVDYEDHVFADKEEEQALKSRFDVGTTPQIILDGERIGGFDDLQQHFGVQSDEQDDEQSYTPVIAVFSTAFAIALALSAGHMGWQLTTLVMSFMGASLCLLALLKLMDIGSFVNGFKEYDLLTMKLPAYGYIYPFLELAAGLGMLSGLWPWATAVIATFAGLIGGVSVFKAVYIDKRDLNCACVGGNQSVPLGAVSFSENAIMLVMGFWIFYTLG